MFPLCEIPIAYVRVTNDLPHHCCSQQFHTESCCRFKLLDFKLMYYNWIIQQFKPIGFKDVSQIGFSRTSSQLDSNDYSQLDFSQLDFSQALLHLTQLRFIKSNYYYSLTRFTLFDSFPIRLFLFLGLLVMTLIVMSSHQLHTVEYDYTVFYTECT